MCRSVDARGLYDGKNDHHHDAVDDDDEAADR
jgi:hypothetical protein